MRGLPSLVNSKIDTDLDTLNELLSEIETVRGQGVNITPENLLLAENATLILPVHPALDVAMEEARGAKKIGTTGRGIGLAYEDKRTLPQFSPGSSHSRDWLVLWARRVSRASR